MFGAKFFEKFTTGGDLGLAGSRMVTSADGQGQGGDVATRVKALPAPTETLKEVFLDIRESLRSVANNTEETVKILRTAVLGPPDPGESADDRDEDIAKGETDKPKGGRFGRALKGIGSALDKVNPFSSGFAFGNIGRALLAGGGLLLLKIFGDNLIGPLASLLEAIKEGKLGEKIMNIVEIVKEKIVTAFQEIKDNITKFLEAVVVVKDFIVGIYNSINDYIMSFDVNEDGKLDETELDELKEDVKNKTVSALSGFFGDVMLSIGGLLLGSTLIGLTAKLAFARLLPLFTGTAMTSAAGAASAAGVTGVAGMGGLATAIPIAGLILYGFTTTYKNITSSLKKTIDEGGDFSDFFANFFGGNDEGGVMNALKQAFLVGGTFALAGMAIGTAILPGPGTIAGGLIGTAVGFAIGAFTGYLGSDALKEKFDGFEAMIDDSVNTARNFYDDIVAGFKSMFRGEGFMKGFRARGEADVEGLTKDLSRAENFVSEIEAFHAANPKLAALPANQKILKDAQDEVNRIKALLVDAPVKAKQYNIDQIEDTLESKIEKRDKLQAKIDKGNLMPGIDSVSQGVPYETQVAILNDEIASLQVDLSKANSAQTLDDLIAVQEGANFKNSTMVFDDIMRKKYEELGMSFVPNTQGGGFLINTSGNTTNSNNTAVNNNSLGGLTVGNQDLITEELIKGVR